MNETGRKALLPAGFRDILPPEAAFEAGIRETLAATFGSYGYERVKPPLVEFEEGLMSGAGAAMANETFRLMDPVSQRMMGVRTDITTQLARIALTRLADAPRPLRLAYTGEVLRVRSAQLRPERQFAQAGAELIGAGSAMADIEIIQMAADSLRDIGLPRLSLDLTIPPLVPLLLDEAGLSERERRALRDALDRKDAGAVRETGMPVAETLCLLMEGTGPARQALKVLDGLALPAPAAQELDRLRTVFDGLDERGSDLDITIDPVENRGFEYHTGVSFTFFCRNERGEIGSGGRYIASLDDDGGGEPATGFTLYIDTILRVLPDPRRPDRILVSADADAAATAQLRRDGWVTILDLGEGGDMEAEARRLGCCHVLSDGRPVPVDPEPDP